MGIREVIEGKRRWRAHTARVKALPPDYQIVYKEMQKYLFKVAPADALGAGLLSELVDFFEEGVAAGKTVSQLVGPDVAAFCDELIESRAHAGASRTSADAEPGAAQS